MSVLALTRRSSGTGYRQPLTQTLGHNHLMSTSIREAKASDWPQIWAILEPVFRAGETYTYAQDITAEQAHHAWLQLPAKTFVCIGADGTVIGTYHLKTNQPGQGEAMCATAATW